LKRGVEGRGAVTRVYSHSKHQRWGVLESKKKKVGHIKGTRGGAKRR